MKKILILILCLNLLFVFNGCSNDKEKENSSIETTDKNQTLTNTNDDEANKVKESDKEENVDSNKEVGDKSQNDSENTKSAQNEQKDSGKSTSKVTDVAKKENKVTGKVKLHNGIYFDDKVFLDGAGEITLSQYNEIVISNVRNTSFDFIINEVKNGDNKKEKKVVFSKSTANFTGKGMEAVFYGKNSTIKFSFPNLHNSHPVVTDIKISGFKGMENKTYVNNSIPGHEFN